MPMTEEIWRFSLFVLAWLLGFLTGIGVYRYMMGEAKAE